MDPRQLLTSTPSGSSSWLDAAHRVIHDAWRSGTLTGADAVLLAPLLDPGRGVECTAALYWLGRLHERGHDPHTARKAYRRVEQLAEGFEDAAERLARLGEGDRSDALTAPPRRVASRDFDAAFRRAPPDPDLTGKVAARGEHLGLGGLTPGSIVADRYQIEAPLGEGGYGVVLRALDLMVEEPVAIKLFRHGEGDPKALERFKQELRITRRLYHPAIVRTYEFGTWRDLTFLTMELMHGRDLSQIPHGELPLRVGLDLLRQALDGLHVAHEAGIVHRDIKPDNLFVLADGRSLKVMDFGLSHARSGLVNATLPGKVVGTPGYVAPERLRGKDAVAASDVWSMGLVLWELVAGRLPWQNTDVGKLFLEILDAPVPPLRSVAPSTPAALDDLAAAMLRKDPSARIASADEASTRLRRVLRDWVD